VGRLLFSALGDFPTGTSVVAVFGVVFTVALAAHGWVNSNKKEA